MVGLATAWIVQSLQECSLPSGRATGTATKEIRLPSLIMLPLTIKIVRIIRFTYHTILHTTVHLLRVPFIS